MRIDHVGLEVHDLYAVELFYRRVLGFEPGYRHASRRSPGLRTVLLRNGTALLELLERPRSRPPGAAGADEGPPHHLALHVEDVDAWHRELAARGGAGAVVDGPRTTGDGCRELTLRDPEGNLVELSSRVAPEPRHPVRAVVFDLDGTLLDSEENYFLADERLLAGFGVPFTREEKRPYIGGGNRDMMVDLVRRFGLPATPDELVERKNAIYLDLAESATPVFAEMRRFLALVRTAGLPVAVASGSSPEVISRLLAATGLADELPVTVSAEEVAHGKPRPDVYLEAARRLGVAPLECLAVEDAALGVEAARRAFMRCLAVPFLVDQPLPEAFHLADLLFAGGPATFDADAAWRWVEGLRG
jgi:HAD superfamily hydrolase (TIGR01509 family)